MSTDTHYVAAAGLIERLLTDQRFRVRFQTDPAATCRDHGLERLAGEFDHSTGPLAFAVEDSGSSLAGLLVASLAGATGPLPGRAGSLPDLQMAIASALAADPRALPVVAQTA